MRTFGTTIRSWSRRIRCLWWREDPRRRWAAAGSGSTGTPSASDRSSVPADPAEVAGRGPGRLPGGRHVETVVVVELEFLFGREVAAHAEVGGVLDKGAVEGDPEGPSTSSLGLQGDEGVPGEQAGAYGGPLRHAGRVVEIDLVDGADLGAVAVERLAADQVARIDVGLHGPSIGRNCIPPSTTKEHIRACGHSGTGGAPLVGWQRLLTPCGRVLRKHPEAPKEQILPGISQAHVPRGRGHSGKQGGHAAPAPALTDGESRQPGRPVKLSG